MKQIVIVSIISLLATALAAAELPDGIDEEVQAYNETMAKLREHYCKQVERSRERLLTKLERELDRSTRNGRLDEAQAIRELIVDLKAEHDAAAIGGSDTAPAETTTGAGGLDLLGATRAQENTSDAPTWQEPMRAAHRAGRSRTTRGSISQFGDGFLTSQAILSPLSSLPAEDRWKPLLERMDLELLRQRKGAEHGNDKRMLISGVARAIDGLLERQRPEIAIIFSDDLSFDAVAGGYERTVAACIDFGTIPVLILRPPRASNMESAEESNRIIREVAERHHCPLIDLPAEIFRRRPGNSWQGTLVKNSGSLIPGPPDLNVDFSEQNLANNGIALFNFLVAEQLVEIIERCCADDD